MSADANPPEAGPKKASKLPLIAGVILALIGGGGGFFAAQSGMIGASDHNVASTDHDSDSGSDHGSGSGSNHGAAGAGSLAFVAIDPLVISLPRTNGRDHLRFAAQLEVFPAYAAEVEAIKPRIVDVLNGYLRAVELAELEDPTALMRLRAQMLRRVQVVAGEGRVKDLLIMEFVLS